MNLFSRPQALPALLALLAGDIRVHWRELCAVALILTAFLSCVTLLHMRQSFLEESGQFDRIAIERDIDTLEQLATRRQKGETDLAPQIEELEAAIAHRLRAMAGAGGAPAIESILLSLLALVLSACTLLLGFLWSMARMVGTSALRWRTIGAKVMREFFPQTLLLCAIAVLSGIWIPLLAVLRARLYATQLPADIANIQVWLLFTGYLAAVLLLPRLALAPVIRLREPMGTAGAIRSSIAGARGYWEKILGNLLFVSCGLLVVSSAVRNAFLFFVFTPLLPVVESFLWVACVMIMGGFLVKLGEEVIAHPRG